MSIQAFLMGNMARLTSKPALRKNISARTLRAQSDMIVRSQRKVPKEVAIETTHLGNVSAERLSINAALPHAAILYIHGGGWNSGSALMYRPITWRLAKQAAIPVYAINQRLAPEHPYPAGLDDCVEAYRALLEQGVAASSIIVAGDSSGGNLVLALALHLKAANMPQPAALVCISTVTDMTSSGASFKTNRASEIAFPPDVLDTLGKIYCPGADLTNPFISPLYGDIAGLPPTYLLASSTELLLDESTRMAEKMKAAGISVTLDVWPGLWHCWPLMADVLPEGKQALSKIALFMREHVDR